MSHPAVKLAYRLYGHSDPPLIILHGLFGSKDNWHSVARQLSTDRRVYTVDQRNHGESPHRQQHTYMEMAEDLAAFHSSAVHAAATVMGHSMGGKTAMQYALLYPQRVTRLVVVDMDPGQGRDRHRSILEGLTQLDGKRIESRRQAEKTLMQTVEDPATCLFLLKNLHRDSEGGYTLKLNLAALRHHYADILAPVEGPPYHGPVLFIRGDRSDYLSAQPSRRIRRLFPAATVMTIHRAGHWVHWEQPARFVQVVRQFADGGKL